MVLPRSPRLPRVRRKLIGDREGPPSLQNPPRRQQRFRGSRVPARHVRLGHPRFAGSRPADVLTVPPHHEQGGVNIYYYAGSEDDSQAMLDVPDENISKMTSLLGGTVDFPVKVWIYDSVEDMRPAIPRRSATYEESVITAGIRITTDTALVLGEASSLH